MGQNAAAFEDFDILLKFGEGRQGTFSAMMLAGRCTDIKIEHKTDRKAQKTGNVFVEYKQRGRPSGIATTKSHFYAIEIAFERWIVMPTTQLQATCRRIMREHPERMVPGGDNDNEGILVPMTELLWSYLTQ